MMEYFSDLQFLKVLTVVSTASIPAITLMRFLFSPLKVFFNRKVRKINKLHSLYGDYKDFLSEEDKTFLKNEIRSNVIGAIVGYKEEINKRKMIFIFNRLKLKDKKWNVKYWIPFVSLNATGNKFELLKTKRLTFDLFVYRIASCSFVSYFILFFYNLYFSGAYFPIWELSLWTCFICIVLVLGVFYWFLPLSSEDLRKINIALLDIDASDFDTDVVVEGKKNFVKVTMKY